MAAVSRGAGRRTQMEETQLISQLQAAADYRAVRRALTRTGVRSIIVGPVALAIGAWAMSQSPTNAILALIGLTMTWAGVLNLASWSLAGLAVDGLVNVALGTWMMGVAVHNALESGGQVIFAGVGIFWIMLGLLSLSKHARFRRSIASAPPTGLARVLEEQMAQVRALADAGSPRVFEFTAVEVGCTTYWLLNLREEMAVAMRADGADILFAGRDDLQIVRCGASDNHGYAPVTITTRYLTERMRSEPLQARVPDDALVAFEAWRQGRDPALAMRRLRVA